jgi:C-terminal binding-module, SLH-like, of glucodextranase
MSGTLVRAARWVAGVTAAVTLSTGAVKTAPDVLFTIADPAGDDHGDGSLLYPLRDDLAPGDLDLRSFTARADADGTIFDATFNRPIRRPDKRAIDAGGGTLDRAATLGFYTFNIDIYIDTDRREGSGRTALLPGRVAEAAPGSAWERAVSLTPRPFLAQSQLARIEAHAAERELRATAPRVDPADVDALHAKVSEEINRRVFFPTRVTVAGASVRFLVPSLFLGGPAQDSWGYIVAVSGSELEERLDLRKTLAIGEVAAERLMILPIEPGRRRESFGGGREDDPLQPPLVDVIVPSDNTQEDVLKDYDIQAKRPVRLNAVVPTS